MGQGDDPAANVGDKESDSPNGNASRSVLASSRCERSQGLSEMSGKENNQARVDGVQGVAESEATLAERDRAISARLVESQHSRECCRSTCRNVLG